MNRTRISIMALAGLFVCSFASLTMAQPGDVTATASDDIELVVETAEMDAAAQTSGSLFHRYTEFWTRASRKANRIGVTRQVPKGFVSVGAEIKSYTITRRYDKVRKEGPAFPLNVTAITGGNHLNVDMGLNAELMQRNFQIAYGITDLLSVNIEIPTMYMDVAMNPSVATIDGQDNKVSGPSASILDIQDRKNYGAADFIYNTLPLLGRPSPATNYTGDWLLGDVSAGVSWNAYRSECKSYPCLSVSFFPRVWFPTASMPDSNHSLAYGMGPMMDPGLGGWSVGSTQGLDVRLYRIERWLDLVASVQVAARYGFEQERDYPTMLTTVAGPAADWRRFPDLSELDGKFRYTPGWQLHWSAQLNAATSILAVGASYNVQFNQDPEIMAPYEFVTVLRNIEQLGQSLFEYAQISAALDFSEFYVPLEVGFQYNIVLDGYNAMKYDDYFTIMARLNIPLFSDI